MNSTKNADPDIEKHKLFFLRTGLVIAIGLVLIAFDWSTSKEVIKKIKEPYTKTEETAGFVMETNLAKLAGKLKITTVANSSPTQTTVSKSDLNNHIKHQVSATQRTDNKDIVTISNGVYALVDEMPCFPGGKKALYQHIANEVKLLRRNSNVHCSSKALVKFVVNCNGKIESASIVKSANKQLDNAALAIIHSMPRWTPGKHNGKTVSVWCSVPICFASH